MDSLKTKPETGIGGVAKDLAPLRNIRVLAFTHYIAGPLVGKALAELGAEVIKIETLTRLDTARFQRSNRGKTAGPDASLTYAGLNAGARSVTINLSTEEGRSMARDLVAVSDIVLDNMRTGLMARWGLAYPDLVRVKPDILMASMSGMGQEGHYAKHRAVGLTLSALGGLQDLTGWPSGDPIPERFTLTDFLSAYLCVTSILAALEHRSATGTRQYIDFTELSTLPYCIADAVLDCSANGADWSRLSNDSPYPPMCPHGVYRCAGDEQWCAIAVENDSAWERLCSSIGHPALGRDPLLETVAQRMAKKSELDALIESWTSKLSRDDVVAILTAQSVTCAAVLRPQELDDDKPIVASRHFQDVAHPLLGSLKISSMWPHIAGYTTHLTRSSTIGEYTTQVLSELLGMSDDKLVALNKAGALD